MEKKNIKPKNTLKMYEKMLYRVDEGKMLLSNKKTAIIDRIHLRINNIKRSVAPYKHINPIGFNSMEMKNPATQLIINHSQQYCLPPTKKPRRTSQLSPLSNPSIFLSVLTWNLHLLGECELKSRKCDYSFRHVMLFALKIKFVKFRGPQDVSCSNKANTL